MDQKKIGHFIAMLRREKGFTQESLGEKLGVTNKTVSRWENGNYMPDIEMLQLLSDVFQVSLNELLAGERLSDEAFRQAAEANIVALSKHGPFTYEERKMFWRAKWRREHASLLLLLAAVVLACCAGPLLAGKPWLCGLGPLVALAAYAWQNNRMMIYVENRLYGPI